MSCFFIFRDRMLSFPRQQRQPSLPVLLSAQAKITLETYTLDNAWGGFYFIMSHVFITLSPCLPLTLCLYPPETTSPEESRTSRGNRLSVHGCNVTVTPPLTIPANFLLLIWQSHRRFGIRSWESDLRCWVYSNISCSCS